MPILPCQSHNLPENIITLQNDQVIRVCSQCFVQSQNEISSGVILNDATKETLISWNKAVLQKLKEMANNVRIKGVNSVIEMKLSPNCPKGLMNELNHIEIGEALLASIEEHEQSLTQNIQFISSRQTLDELDVEELLKDIYTCFMFQTQRGLIVLLEKVKSYLSLKIPQKTIYQYFDYFFAPKELRPLELKRKSLINKVKATSLLQNKKNNEIGSPNMSRSRVSERSSPTRSPLLNSESKSNVIDDKIGQIAVIPPSQSIVISSPVKVEEIEDYQRQSKEESIVENNGRENLSALKEQINNLSGYKDKYEIAQSELSKIKQELALKERSITQLNKLIGNEEQQLQYRQTEVETLTREITKLVDWKQRCQQTEKRLAQKEQELLLREKGIKELNNVIGNQQEELAYRQSQVTMLSEQLKKAQSAKLSLEKQLQQVTRESDVIKKHNSQLQVSLQKAQSSSAIQDSSTLEDKGLKIDEQLLQQVIQLEGEVASKTDDINTLIGLVKQIQKTISKDSEKEKIVETLKKLRTVEYLQN